MRKNIFFFCLILFWSICLKAQSSWIKDYLDSDFYKAQFTGFYLYDPATGEVLENYNGDKYFTPASNVKIFTLYGGMKVLSDSIPAMKYEYKNGDLYIEGTGDPTFLNPNYKGFTKVLDFLKNHPGEIYLHWGVFEGPRMGVGWAWEDYEKHYAPERSELPLYENMLTIHKKRGGTSYSVPPTLADSIEYEESVFNREFFDNKFYLGSRNGATTKVPFITKKEIIQNMLSEAVGKEIHLTEKPLSKNAKLFYSLPSDLVFKRMMEKSDNFLAEQVLLMVSSQVNSSLSSEKAINYIKSKYLKDIPDDPVWVDGSGLSRYNLFSPRDMTFMLEKLHKEIPENRLFNIFAIGGRTGTLKGNYGGKRPYVYAKSGTLSNNYTLSGYLVTNTGRTLIFSVMNNHYQKPNWQVRRQTEKLLEYVRDNF